MSFEQRLSRAERLSAEQELSEPSDDLPAEAWRLEMLRRTRDGKPLVTEAEFAELARWFDANADRLYRMAGGQLLQLPGGRETTTANVRYGLWRGARAIGAGEVAEDLRQLRRLYGEGES